MESMDYIRHRNFTGWKQWVLYIVVLLLTKEIHTAVTELKEYCQFEKFEGKCSMNDVILIKTAQYGRMRTGKCISGEGYIGCNADVRPYLDSLCSGRHACTVDVTEIRDVAQPCKKDFTSYLEVSYECVRVAKGTSNVCRHPHDVRLPPTSGYLATITTTETGLGSPDCPWLLAGTAGQRVSLSVLDFGTVTRDGQDKWVHSNYNARNCPVHLVVHDGSARSRTPLCGVTGDRERHLLRSKANKVRMHVTMQMQDDPAPHFLVRYKVAGCPDIKTPRRAHTVRNGDNAVVKCNDTQETWYITCDGEKWIGDLGNCTGGSWGIKRFFGTRIPVTQGILIAVAIGVALGIVFGSTMLAAVLYCRRKCRRHHHAHVDQDSDDAVERDTTNYPSLLKHGSHVDPRGTGPHRSTSAAKTGTGTGTGTNMADMGDDVRPPDFTAPTSGVSYDIHYNNRRSHIYECPNPPRRPEDGVRDPPAYFELDPDVSCNKSSRSKAT